jgi:coenzyme F420-dependent glucose-6-phosphate dehydrogenase
MTGAPLRLGYKASAEQFDPNELLRFALLAESIGFDSVWTSDHFQPWRHTGGHAPFSLAWLGALGARSERMLIGTSVLTPTFRYHPAVVAQAFATLATMFPARIALGLGTGESLNETPATGLAWPEQKERTGRFKEAVDLIRRLWRDDRVNYSGTYYTTKNATIYDKPAPQLPIYIAAAGPVLAKFAGERGDGFICTSGKKWELYTQTLLPNVQAGLNNRDPRSRDLSNRDFATHYDHMIEIKLSFDLDRDRALEDTRWWGALALTPEEKLDIDDPLQMERLADALPIERTASRWIVSNDVDEVIERVGHYVHIGFNHLVFHAPGADQARFITLFGELIAPRLRRAFG